MTTAAVGGSRSLPVIGSRKQLVPWSSSSIRIAQRWNKAANRAF